jgi:F-type H+-transporting ATPase subunit a
MPEHQTWFKFLPNYEALRAYFQGEFGRTWIGHQTIDLQHVLGTVLVILVLFIFGLLVWGKVRDAKKALIPESKLTPRTFAELLTEMVLNQMETMMSPKEARTFLPLIGTCAFFIFFSNAMGLIPGFAPPTANLNTTLACAFTVVMTSELYGFKRHGFGYVKEFLGPLHKPIHFLTLLPLMMFVIELIGHIARMVSLSVRLLGNMYADHTVVGIFTTLVPFVPVLIPLPVQLLGVLVVVIQTVVFCLLSMVYISLAVAGEEAEEHGSH